MNNQIVFNDVVKHLFKQGKQSLSIGNLCSYRGTDNTKCAIGCLIPDELYDSSMERRSIKDLIFSINNIKNLFKDVNKEMLYDLQQCHDTYPIKADQTFNKTDLKRRLKYVANTYNLEYKNLEELK